MTASIAATINETISVSLIAATACGLVIASQNAPTPPSSERTTTAASGIRMISVSQATESPAANSAPRAAEAAPRRRGTRRPAGGCASAGSGDPQVTLDLGDGAVLGVEELVVDLAQPPNSSILNSDCGAG